jgi:glycosyltransferase involved in cell wall biosynthesis
MPHPHILIVSINGDPLADLGTMHAGGQCKYILELGKHLVRDGWTIDVFTTLAPGSPELASIAVGFDVIRFPLADRRAYDGELTAKDIEILGTAMSNRAAASARPYDVILACYWYSALISLRIRALTHKRLIVTFCSLAYFKLQAVETPALVERLETEKRLAREADHVIATSKSERDVLVTTYKVPASHISVIPRGVDLDVFRPS